MRDTPLGNVNKEKSHFSSYWCFVLVCGTFFFLHSRMAYLVPCDLQLHGLSETSAKVSKIKHILHKPCHLG